MLRRRLWHEFSEMLKHALKLKVCMLPHWPCWSCWWGQGSFLYWGQQTLLLKSKLKTKVLGSAVPSCRGRGDICFRQWWLKSWMFGFLQAALFLNKQHLSSSSTARRVCKASVPSISRQIFSLKLLLGILLGKKTEIIVNVPPKL